MKESVHSLKDYETYPIAASPHAENLAENREAKMLSVIAEVGFHTNAEDSAAIQDPAFQKAMMRGMEKGYRLYLSGVPPQTFAITSGAQSITLRPGEVIPVEVAFSGYPRFPITRTSEAISCPGHAICSGSTTTIPETTSPFVSQATCGTDYTDSGSFTWGVTYVDADGLTAKSELEMRCEP